MTNVSCGIQEPLEGDQFIFQIPSLDLSMSLTKVIFPSVKGGTLSFEHQGYTIYKDSNYIEYSPLEIYFRIDKNFQNYANLFNWKLSSAFTNDDSAYRDCYLLVTNETGSAKVQFFRMFVTDLLSFTFDISVTEPLICNASLKFSKMKIIL